MIIVQDCEIEKLTEKLSVCGCDRPDFIRAIFR